MITDDQLRQYAETLPSIYREILSAFPRIEPFRKQGYGLAFQTLSADFDELKKGISLGEIIQACEELKRHGLAEIKNGIFVHPTNLGERLIAVIVGQQAPLATVPELPALPPFAV